MGDERIEAAARGAFEWDDCYPQPWETFDKGVHDWYRGIATAALAAADASDVRLSTANDALAAIADWGCDVYVVASTFTPCFANGRQAHAEQGVSRACAPCIAHRALVLLEGTET